jgi:hypothetical protein
LILVLLSANELTKLILVYLLPFFVDVESFGGCISVEGINEMLVLKLCGECLKLVRKTEIKLFVKL